MDGLLEQAGLAEPPDHPVYLGWVEMVQDRLEDAPVLPVEQRAPCVLPIDKVIAFRGLVQRGRAAAADLLQKTQERPAVIQAVARIQAGVGVKLRTDCKYRFAPFPVKPVEGELLPIRQALGRCAVGDDDPIRGGFQLCVKRTRFGQVAAGAQRDLHPGLLRQPHCAGVCRADAAGWAEQRPVQIECEQFILCHVFHLWFYWICSAPIAQMSACTPSICTPQAAGSG